jgi:hypothetical protein
MSLLFLVLIPIPICIFFLGSISFVAFLSSTPSLNACQAAEHTLQEARSEKREHSYKVIIAVRGRSSWQGVTNPIDYPIFRITDFEQTQEVPAGMTILTVCK